MTLGRRYRLRRDARRPRPRHAVIITEPRPSHDGTLSPDAALWYLFDRPLRTRVTMFTRPFTSRRQTTVGKFLQRFVEVSNGQ